MLLLKQSFKKNNKLNTDQIAGLQNAFEIYGQIEGVRSNAVINIMCKVCLHFKQPEQVELIWNDILKRQKNKPKIMKDSQDVTLSYHLLLSCCINSNSFNIDKCIDILKWIKSNKFKIGKHSIKDYSKDITKLISNCNQPSMLNQLQSIHSLIDKKVIKQDMFINSELMYSYEKCAKDVRQSLNVFNSIKDNSQNAFSIGVIMKLLSKYQRYKELLSIYDKYQSLTDQIQQVCNQ